MFYLSCPSAPLTINLRQCHYHHCHHQCYISVVIVFASAMINLNIWYTEPGQGLEFLDTPCIGQPEKRRFIDFRAKAPLASWSFYSPRQCPAMEHHCCWCCWTRSDQPDFFSHFWNNSVWQSCLGAESPVYGEIWKDTSSHSHHQEGEDQHLFNDYFHFYGERG